MYDSGQLERVREHMEANREEWEQERRIGLARYWHDVLETRSGIYNTTLVDDVDLYRWGVGQLAMYDIAHGAVRPRLNAPSEEVRNVRLG